MNFRALIPIKRFREPPPVVAVVNLGGVIGQMGLARNRLNITTLAEPLERAFKLSHLKAVALAVNSPGGSPAQSALIAKLIRDLAQEHEVPVLAFAEDVAASGGYWLACAADEIFAQDNSIVGSIGVVTSSFGFPELLKRLGVERRLYTSGERKALLDPFQDEKPGDVKRLKGIHKDLHEGFKEMVRQRRSGKLNAPDKELFSGEFWTGRKALELGLIDGIGDMRAVMRERYGDKVKFKAVQQRRPWWRWRASSAAAWPAPGDGGTWAGELLAAVEERLFWNRFGL